MANKVRDLTGQRYGKLIAIERSGSDKSGHAKWLCICDCGNFANIPGILMTNGRTKSCGCLKREQSKELRTTHGLTRTRLYGIWANMKQRCSNEKDIHYADYGGRGIIVCKEWEQFEPFYEWSISTGYSDTLTIDRIDVNGNYCPQNCRWATMKEQQNNKRSNDMITFNGKTMTIKQWSEETGIKYLVLWRRIKKFHWDIERALTLPAQNK